jgi:hypothetical protein
LNKQLQPETFKPLNLPTFNNHPRCGLEVSSLHSLTVSISNFLPLLGRGGHPFFLDKKGRKSQGKTKSSARFSGQRAHHRSEKNLVNLKIIA